MPSKRKATPDLVLNHGCAETPFGNAWIAWNESGIARLAFGPASSAARFLKAASKDWPEAGWKADDKGAARLLKRCFKDPDSVLRDGVLLRGSEFQHQVWHVLLTLPAGSTATYGEIAAAIGKPRASRAVGTAVGANPVAWLVPCHRVLPSAGGLGGYAWGPALKRRLLEAEGVRVR